MDRAAKRAPAGALLGAAILVSSVVLPQAAPRAATPIDGGGLFITGLACGAADTPPLVGRGGPLARVRADAAPTPRRSAAADPKRSERKGVGKAARPVAPPRSAKKAPPMEQEPRAAVLRSFYTCNTAPAPDLTEGTGWRWVGPLRRS